MLLINYVSRGKERRSMTSRESERPGRLLEDVSRNAGRISPIEVDLRRDGHDQRKRHEAESQGLTTVGPSGPSQAVKPSTAPSYAR
jgi:hypothetical protein